MTGKRRLDNILSPEYLGDIETISTEQIRAMRAECLEEEAVVSYERRLLQARLDLLRAEIKRRETGDKTSLVELLPQILAEEGQMGGRGSLPMNDPDLSKIHPQRRVTKLVSNDTLLNLADRTDDEVRALIVELEAAEGEVSVARRPLLTVLDTLNEELARRYKSGAANPSDVLSDRGN